MKKNILQNLAQHYFQGIADDISNAKVISSTFSNTSDVGDIRENILLKFLQLHLPSRCSVVKGGCVFDSLANELKQIDLLVVNDFSLRFSYFDKDSLNSKNIQTIEGCLAAISVKSTLDKGELCDALDNLASIPKMPTSILEKINPQLNTRASYLNFPKKVVFAISGKTAAYTILENINDFYAKRSTLEDYQKADIVIVNNAFCIQRAGKGGAQTRNGTQIPEGVYALMCSEKDKFGALLLFWLLNIIQKTTLFSPHILFDYQDYINGIDFHCQ